MKEKTKADAYRFIQSVARHQGWVVNPETEFLDDLAAGLASNHNRHGYCLCPCRDGEGDQELDADITCPCAYAAADIAEYGHCMCGLFLSKSFAASGRLPSAIPERRPWKE